MADKKSKRVSMQGMGADAFFASLLKKTEQEETIEGGTATSKNRDTSTPASQEAIQPVETGECYARNPADTALPVSQQSRTPAKTGPYQSYLLYPT